MFQVKKHLRLDTTTNNEELMDSKHTGIRISHTTDADFTLPQVKRKALASQRASLQFSSSIEDQQTSQASSGYSSALLSSSSSLNQQNTPKKRHSASSESDENFYNSFSFISPVKYRVKENCAKKILKEKSSSENVIRCSTPVQNPNKASKLRFGKFRSFHPENVDNAKLANNGEVFKFTGVIPNVPETIGESESFAADLSSFDITNASTFELSVEQTSSATPQRKIEASFAAVEDIEKPTPIAFKRSNLSGRERIDFIGRLSVQRDFAVDDILNNLKFNDLLNLSLVSTRYREIVRSNKEFETKRLNYLEIYKRNQENYPGLKNYSQLQEETFFKTDRKDVSRLGDYNKNASIKVKATPSSPPVSPSRRRFHENQKVANSFSGKIKKCPRCNAPSKIHNLKIRKSPRKKKRISLMKISNKSPGRVQKKSRTFLSTQTSIVDSDISHSLMTTFPGFDSPCKKSPRSNSSSGSPSTPSSDESSASDGSIFDSVPYSYAECTGKNCCYKFCPKCNYRSHPGQNCKELSPISPVRGSSNNSSIACSRQSLKSLKRLNKLK